MPLKQGSTDVVRLYKKEVGLIYVYYGLSLPPGATSSETLGDPEGQSCSIEGRFISYNPGSGYNYYRCQEGGLPQTEVTHLKDNLDQTIHKRVKITFLYNGVLGSSSQIRTWGVEQITQPASPTRSGYDFQGWATTSNATSPNVTFPRSTPENDISYYAVWKQQAANLTWQYQGTSSSPICNINGYNPIGLTCSTKGSTMVVSASDIGRTGQCHTLVCKE